MLSKLFFISILSSFIFITHSCLHHQKILLLQLKDELSFNSSLSTKLVRWNERDECCQWPGVACDAAGYVVSLQLDNESISGGIEDSSSLFKLVHLQKLNLAYNYFNYTHIPKGIHNLTYLTHLNLSTADFAGQVPLQLSFLRRLVCLDISNNQWYFEYPSLELPNLEMLVQNLTGLRELYLNYANFTSSHEKSEWSHIISSYLPNLTTLSLRGCGLSGPLAKSFWQLHSLSFLGLDYNDLGPELPDLFANFPTLATLSLPGCNLKGSIPSTFANLTNLIRLDLSYNSFSGNIPHSLFALPSLLELDLRNNQFSGTFQLDNFRNLANLTRLDLSHNRLSVDVGNLNSTSYGSLQLKEVGLASCNLSHFPNFIKHLDMERVDLSDNRIGGEIPSWIWGTQLRYLNLAFNVLTHLQKPYHIPASLKYLILQSNQLKGELHLPIPRASQLSYLSLGNNSLNGSIPTSLCSATQLYQFDLSGNKLSGGIPPCLYRQNIRVIILGRTNISGSIPDNFPMDCSLQYLDLNNNALEGKIPKSLQSCRSLVFLNVGNNNINDTFPCMLSSTLRLRSLILRSNRFHGEVTCHTSWPELQIIDISSNNFSGSLESINFSSWRSMVYNVNNIHGYYPFTVTLNIKGQFHELHKIWKGSGTIDFSCNNFGGEIPNAIGDLTSLHQLNFSHNALNGSIPNSFGQLKNLESLDLSGNRLTGLIPVELAGLTFLSFLNLSFNKLVYTYLR